MWVTQNGKGGGTGPGLRGAGQKLHSDKFLSSELHWMGISVKDLLVTGGPGNVYKEKHSELASQALGQAHQKYQIEGKLGPKG